MAEVQLILCQVPFLPSSCQGSLAELEGLLFNRLCVRPSDFENQPEADIQQVRDLCRVAKLASERCGADFKTLGPRASELAQMREAEKKLDDFQEAFNKLCDRSDEDPLGIDDVARVVKLWPETKELLRQHPTKYVEEKISESLPSLHSLLQRWLQPGALLPDQACHSQDFNTVFFEMAKASQASPFALLRWRCVLQSQRL